MAARRKQTDLYVQEILETLQREYLPTHPKARIDAYRYNSACIMVRIIDREFAGKPITRRDEPIWKILEQHLPENVRIDIGVLLLLAPEETETSAMNWEFEHPTPTPGSYVGNGKSSLKRRRPASPSRSATAKGRKRRPPAAT